MINRLGLVAAGTIAAAATYGLISTINSSAEARRHGPRYTVIEDLSDGVEVRSYQSTIIAQVRVTGEHKEALNDGFRILAAYIFGKNAKRAPVSMTSPVVAESGKIDMTSPVTSQSTGSMMTVSFFMPAEYTLATLPTPVDSRIQFVQLPPRKIAAIGFSGLWNPEAFYNKAEELMTRLRLSHLQPVGAPFNAYYDPPFMPFFMRRNEVLVVLAD